MTYLELCQQTIEASGTGEEVSFTSLTDVDQFKRGVTRKVVEAWRFIQTLHEGWGWRQREFTAQLRSGVSTYKWNELFEDGATRSIPPDVGFRDWLSKPPGDDTGPEWYISSPSNNYGSVTSLTTIPYEGMRARRYVLTASAKPTVFAISPAVELILHATPDAAHRIHGMHVTGVQVLSSPNDIPALPDEEYHDIIKWRAVMMVHGFDDSDKSFVFANDQYTEMLESLSRKYLPSVTIAGSVA